jgi:hypothetical protein
MDDWEMVRFLDSNWDWCSRTERSPASKFRDRRLVREDCLNRNLERLRLLHSRGKPAAPIATIVNTINRDQAEFEPATPRLPRRSAGWRWWRRRPRPNYPRPGAAGTGNFERR